MSENNQNSQGPRNNYRDGKEPRVPSHVRIVVHRDDSIEKVIRKFKKLCEKAGIKKEIKARSYYEKPSEARRREARKNERNRRKIEKGKTEKRIEKKEPRKPKDF